MQYANPYTPGAGAMPAYLAGRDDIINNASKSLIALNKGYPQQSVIYYGLRGVGTVSYTHLTLPTNSLV